MKGCLENLMGYGIFVIVLGFLAAPFVIAAATAALPFIAIGGLVWLLVRVLRSQWLSDHMAAQRRVAQAATTKTSSPPRVPNATTGPSPNRFAGFVSPQPPPSASAPRSGGVVGHASGRPFRVYEANQPLQRPLLYAEEYDDGRLRGFAVYGGRSGGVTILPTTEFVARYRRWNE